MIDDESLVKTRTNTCLSYTSAVPSYHRVEIYRDVTSVPAFVRMLGKLLDACT